MTTTSSHGQGAVRNPATDGRLKEQKATASASADHRHQNNGQGAMKNAATDGRSKARS